MNTRRIFSKVCPIGLLVAMCFPFLLCSAQASAVVADTINVGTIAGQSNTGITISSYVYIASTLTVAGTAFSVGGGSFVVSGGNVGIGTTNPTAPLYVAGTGVINSAGSLLNLFGDSVTIDRTGVGGGTLELLTASFGELQSSIDLKLIAGTDPAFWASAGTLHAGIETTATHPYSLTVGDGGNTVDSQLAIDAYTSNTASLLWLKEDVVKWKASIGNAQSDLVWNDGTSDRIIFKSGGNVGIGTTSPNAQLQVTGGNIYTSTAGDGIIVKSPDGLTCKQMGIDNTGALSLTAITCP